MLRDRIGLVPRTRSSHHIAAGTVANFGFKSGTRIIDLLVSFSIPKFAQKSRQMLANFGIGTLASPQSFDRSRSATRRAISVGASSGIGNTELTLISPST